MRGGKCRFHGGMSTGAKTPEGKARSMMALWASQEDRIKKDESDNPAALLCMGSWISRWITKYK